MINETASLAPAATTLDLGAEDLGASLDEATQEREVLPLGVALVTTRPQVLQREVGEALDELGSPDPVDPSVAALFAHENRIVARRAARGGKGSADGEQHLVRVDGRSTAGMPLEMEVVDRTGVAGVPHVPDHGSGSDAAARRAEAG